MSALRSPLGPLAAFLHDGLVVEIMINADSALWIENMGLGVIRTPVRLGPGEAERLVRLAASEGGSPVVVRSGRRSRTLTRLSTATPLPSSAIGARAALGIVKIDRSSGACPADSSVCP